MRSRAKMVARPKSKTTTITTTTMRRMNSPTSPSEGRPYGGACDLHAPRARPKGDASHDSRDTKHTRLEAVGVLALGRARGQVDQDPLLPAHGTARQQHEPRYLGWLLRSAGGLQ